MQKIFEKIIEGIKTDFSVKLYGSRNSGNYMIPVEKAIEIVKQIAAEYDECYKDCGECEGYNKEKHHCPKFCKVITDAVKEIEENHNGWISCSERLPENENEVEITFIRQHYKTGKLLYLTARAFYEDGTLTTEDSGYGWNETDNWEYCEEKDAFIIPEGWYEGISFTEEFGIVDMPVIAWRYLTEPYQPKGE